MKGGGGGDGTQVKRKRHGEREAYFKGAQVPYTCKSDFLAPKAQKRVEEYSESPILRKNIITHHVPTKKTTK